jgi:predicted ester cyclase
VPGLITTPHGRPVALAASAIRSPTPAQAAGATFSPGRRFALDPLRGDSVRSPSIAVATAAENKEVVRRLMEEVLGQGRVKLLPDLVAAEYVGHLPTGDHYGPEGVRIDIAAYRTAFPDLVVTLEDLLADGEHVARHFTLRGTHRRPFFGVPASGEPVMLRGIAIDRLVRGLLMESWVQLNGLPLDP